MRRRRGKLQGNGNWGRRGRARERGVCLRRRWGLRAREEGKEEGKKEAKGAKKEKLEDLVSFV